MLLLVFIEHLLELLKDLLLRYHLINTISNTIVAICMFLLVDGSWRILGSASVCLRVLNCGHRLIRATHELALALRVIVLLRRLLLRSIVLFLNRYSSSTVFVRLWTLSLKSSAYSSSFLILIVWRVARLSLLIHEVVVVVVLGLAATAELIRLLLEKETAILVRAHSHLVLLECWWDQTFPPTRNLLTVLVRLASRIVCGILTCFGGLLRDRVWRSLLRGVEVWLARRSLFHPISAASLFTVCYLSPAIHHHILARLIMLLSIWIAHSMLFLVEIYRQALCTNHWIRLLA